MVTRTDKNVLVVTAVTEVFLKRTFWHIAREHIFAVKAQQIFTFRMSWGNVDHSQAPEREQEVEEVKSRREVGMSFLQCKSTKSQSPFKTGCERVRLKVLGKQCEVEKQGIEYFLRAYRAPWVWAPVGARRARLSIALLTIWWLVMDLAAQIVETLAVWTLTNHLSCLYPTSTWLVALREAGGEVVFYR